MAKIPPIDIDVKFNVDVEQVTPKRITIDLVSDFLGSIPDSGILDEGFDMLMAWIIKHTYYRSFRREELNWIQRRADYSISDNMNPQWKKALQDLSYAASVLDAFNARTALPKGTVVEAPDQIDPKKMLSKLNLGQFELQIWDHGMFVIWNEEDHSHQKWIDFARLN